LTNVGCLKQHEFLKNPIFGTFWLPFFYRCFWSDMSSPIKSRVRHLFCKALQRQRHKELQKVTKSGQKYDPCGILRQFVFGFLMFCPGKRKFSLNVSYQSVTHWAIFSLRKTHRITVFSSSYFRTLWPNWLKNLFRSFQTQFSLWSKKNFGDASLDLPYAQNTENRQCFWFKKVIDVKQLEIRHRKYLPSIPLDRQGIKQVLKQLTTNRIYSISIASHG